MSNLYGIHDAEGAGLVPSGGFCVALVELSKHPEPVNYGAIRPDINWLVRLNWGYGSTGTIPSLEFMQEYFAELKRFVVGSKGVLGYIIGNEPNHENERPDGKLISPELYANIFVGAYRVIKQVAPGTQVGPAAIAPYHANPVIWTEYIMRMCEAIRNNGVTPDFLPIHAYCRGSSPAGIYSTATMDAPLQGTSNSFLTFRDAIASYPSDWRNTPFDITEFNTIETDGWVDQDSGVIKAAYQVVNQNNQTSLSFGKIRSLSVFRYPHYDMWYIEGKQNVINDFKNAVSEGFQSPQEGQEGVKHTILMPSIKNDTKNAPGPSTGFERTIDEDCVKRGVTVQETWDGVSEFYWVAKEVYWLDVAESQGRHHIYFDTLDEFGKRLVGVKLRVTWSTGVTTVESEAKPGEPYAANYPMSASRNDYSVKIADSSFNSDFVSGIGMGADLGGGFNAGEHTSTCIVYQRVKTGAFVTPIRIVNPLKMPIAGLITQYFGENEEKYKRFSYEGVPLRGHNGVDFGVPTGTDVLAVDSGEVIEAAFDPDGYGLYIKIRHVWGESLYAHLEKSYVTVDNRVTKGSVIALSGNSGNSSGPHLHFGMRVNPYNRADGFGGFIDPLPYLHLEEASKPTLTFTTDALEAVKVAAQENNLDWKLLASLAMAESSFVAATPGGGLFQLGDATWSDFAPKIGATDKYNALDNARVGAMYLAYLLNYFNRNLDKALVAYNFGIGNVINGIDPPAITIEYVNKVKFGRDLLNRVV